MTKHLLITGGAGYLGSYVVKELLANKYVISILVRSTSSLSRLEFLKDRLNIVKVEDVNSLFEHNKIDGIIHFATNYGRKEESLSDILYSNLVFPIKLFELATRYKIEFFINTDTSLPRDLNMYSLSKAQFKDWLISFPSELKVINVIPEYFYGPNDDDTKFITGILKKLNKNDEFIDLTEGIQKRDFIYIDDVVSAYMSLIKSIDKLENYSDIPLGTSNTISLRNLVELMKKKSMNTNTTLNFGKIPIRKGDVMESKADISKLLSLGWKPTVSIEEGINKIINYLE